MSSLADIPLEPIDDVSDEYRKTRPVRLNKKTNHVETMSDIAMAEYKTFKLWPLIWKSNYPRIKDPNKMIIGMKLFIVRTEKVTDEDRRRAEKIYLKWNNIPFATKLLREWIAEDEAFMNDLWN